MGFAIAQPLTALSRRAARVVSRWVAAATVMVLAMGVHPAAAEDHMAYFQFGTVPGSSSTYDREFIREWESNPPMGYATLGKSNIDPTKAAIKRYSDIVAAGGWPSVPTVQMQAGMSAPSVAMLRTRLAASGDLKDEDDGSASFDMGLEKAVKRFQASNGLT
ncbi:MAG: peptidoglycan-binding protein, partial [Hyphomicrobium sp.]